MRAAIRKAFPRNLTISRGSIQDFILLLIGAALQAISLRIFLVPSQLASGGVSGLAQIVNHFTGWPIGVMVLIGNIPLFLMGWRYLGGRRFAIRTAMAVFFYSLMVDIPVGFIPENGITDDLILNALYGGVISGIGFGLVYRGRGTSGGSDIIARILNHWRGIPISQSYMMTDALIIFLAGISFSWENALYALVMLYISGIVAEAVTEGSKVVRTALIISSNPAAVKEKVLTVLGRGITEMHGKGGYTGVDRVILYCVITRAEIAQLKTLVNEADENAFLVIGQAHEALGEGFQRLEID